MANTQNEVDFSTHIPDYTIMISISDPSKFQRCLYLLSNSAVAQITKLADFSSIYPPSTKT